MARNIVLQPRTVTISATVVWTTVFDLKYNPTLSTTLTNWSTTTYTEWTASGVFTDSTTAQTYYIDNIVDNLVTKYWTAAA